MTMSVSSQAVANKFLQLANESGKPLTNMQLQKLVFIAHGFTLAILDRPLYHKDTHAWQFGPVIPNLYKALQKYGNGFVKDSIETDDSLDEDSPEMGIIKAVWKSYGHMTGAQLSSLTHKPGTPWSITWAEKQFGVIQPEIISGHYKNIIGAS
jgi:uncharacterized phage-associated protein